MPICNHCEAAINELDCTRDLSQDTRAWVEHGAIRYDQFNTHSDKRQFWCPRCKYIIARNEKDALVFLTATPATGETSANPCPESSKLRTGDCIENGEEISYQRDHPLSPSHGADIVGRSPRCGSR